MFLSIIGCCVGRPTLYIVQHLNGKLIYYLLLTVFFDQSGKLSYYLLIIASLDPNDKLNYYLLVISSVDPSAKLSYYLLFIQLNLNLFDTINIFKRDSSFAKSCCAITAAAEPPLLDGLPQSDKSERATVAAPLWDVDIIKYCLPPEVHSLP